MESREDVSRRIESWPFRRLRINKLKYFAAPLWTKPVLLMKESQFISRNTHLMDAPGFQRLHIYIYLLGDATL